jgi:hypothetical protein
MMIIINIIFSIIFSLLLVHEMDAIRNREWKMFVIMKNMKDEKAYKLFTIFHIPLYGLILGLIMFSETQYFAFYLLDVFIIIHTFLHLFFERHKNNEFKNIFSKCLIYSMGILAVIHIFLLISI